MRGQTAVKSEIIHWQLVTDNGPRQTFSVQGDTRISPPCLNLYPIGATKTIKVQ
jgi:hypothetical protein